ncbi:hypothetical protein [Flavobacterium sp.]|uniref:hypothetical protein n=1 Tax=Flavobacterium sp. TaxID=239 RepID=UPI00286AD22B|nr:hypothetical protein [Flavobacterium sp.]
MKKILLRFLSCYFLLTICPWLWFDRIPGVALTAQYFTSAIQWIVNSFNTYFLHIAFPLNFDGGGSGDTSYAWAEYYTSIIISLIVCLIWTFINKRTDYKILAFWLRNLVRYHIAIIAFSYGFIKLFVLQMPFPSLSQLATPLGDFLPMRLSWMFMGYSGPYQLFSGVMEIIVGLCLFNRKTVSLGAFIGLGVFANVFAINLSYDVPVKLFSLQLAICCLFLVLNDYKRFVSFFLHNLPAESSAIYSIVYTKKWQKAARLAWKIGFVILFIVMPFYDSLAWYRQSQQENTIISGPIKPGVYSIEKFSRNNIITPIAVNDAMAWKDFIFENGGGGSINTKDTLFSEAYGRGYFFYEVDAAHHSIKFKNSPWETEALFTMKYTINNSNGISLCGKVKNDSLSFELRKSSQHFQLAEKQFHWISESNR